MGRMLVDRSCGCRGLREPHDRPRHFHFGGRRVLGDLLEHVPVAVAGGKVHPCVHAARILAQRSLGDAHRFDELPPVRHGKKTQAAYAVRDRYLVGGLMLTIRLYQLLQRLAGFGQTLLDPGQRQRQRRALPLQPACELRHEPAGHGRVRARHVGNHEDQALRIALDDRGHLVGPGIGEISADAGSGNACPDPAQVLDESKAEHDRDRPQLAQVERCHRLIRRDESDKAFGIHPSVTVRDGFERDVVDPRQPRRRSVREPWQLRAVSLGQMSARCADLLLDEVEVVEQPLARRRNRGARLDRCRQQIAGFEQDGLVLRQAREQQIAPAFRSQCMRRRERPAVMLHLIGAEELRP